jgi:hypothetical protein
MPFLQERGLFWWSDEVVPDNHFAPDASVAGLLTIDNDGRITLDLDGFLPSEHGPFAALTDVGVTLSRNIRGILKTTGDRVLLHGVIRGGGSVHSSNISYESFGAIDCLVSDSTRLEYAAPLMFDRLEVKLSGFESWFWFRSIKVSHSGDDITAEYKRPSTAVYDIDEGMLSLDFYVMGSIPFSGQRDKVSMKEEASLRFTLTDKETLEQLRDRYRFLEELLILLIDSEHRLPWPIITLQDETKVRWYFARFKNDEPAKAPELHECLTYFPKLRESFGAIWSNWQSKRKKFGPGFYSYLGTRRGMSLYTEHRFINLIWGIEAFHRTKYPANPDAMQMRIDAIVDQVSEAKDKKFLRRKLKYAHEPALEERIYSTFKALPIDLDHSRLRSFAKACADARNDISHGVLRHGAPYSDFVVDLAKKSRALSILYHCLILQEIGIGEETLRNWIWKGFGSFRIKYSFVEVDLLDPEVLKPETPRKEPAYGQDWRTENEQKSS